MNTTRKQPLKIAGFVPASLLVILAVAIFLRFFKIGHQSLWADEMSSLVTAMKPIPQLLYDISNEIHPPLYHLMLKAWIYAFGTSEAGLRSLSATFGILLVLLTYAIGRRLLGRTVGLLAAALSAIAPFQVYYSQEARMYMPLAATSALAVYGFIRFLEVSLSATRRTIWAWAIVYIAANGLGLWLHYSYPIILVMENGIFVLWWLLTRRQPGSWSRLLYWVFMQILAIALYLPWLPIAYRQVSGWPSISESHGLGFIVQEAFRLFAFGESVDPRTVGLATIGFAVIFVAGLWPLLPNHKEGPERRAFAITSWVLSACYVLFPVLLMYALSLVRPAYRPKFFLVGSAGFCIVIARGILGPWPRHRGLACRSVSVLWTIGCLALVLWASTFSLRNYFFVPRFARDDYRGMARYIEQVGKAGDAVLLNAPGQRDVFDYYYRGNLPVYPLPRQRPVNVEKTVAELEEIAQKTRKIFAIYWATEESDPGRVVEGWLDAHAYKALDSWRGNVRLVIYSMPSKRAFDQIQHPVDVVFGDRIALLGYNLLQDRVRSGEVLQVTLVWKALAPIPDRYSVFLHVLDADNHIVGQRDAEPGGGVRLTSTWKVGETIVDNYGILIRPGTPPGSYRVELGLYRVDNGQRLPVTKGNNFKDDHLLLPAIQIEPAEGDLPVEALGVQHLRYQKVGYLEFQGYDLYRLGHEHEEIQDFTRGDVAHLNLYWQALQPSPNLSVTVQFLTGDGTVRFCNTRWLGSKDYPTSLWRVGETIRDQHDIPLTRDWPAGTYRIVVQLEASSTAQSSLPTITLDPFTIR